MEEQFRQLATRADQINLEMKTLFPRLAAARHSYTEDGTEANWQALEQIQHEASALHEEFGRLIAEMPSASGLPLELFEESGQDGPEVRPGRDQLPRENLTSDLVAATANIDELLPEALEHVESLLPKGWLDEEPSSATRIQALTEPDAFLSLTKGLRLESESSPVHRLRQAINVSKDYLEGNPLYDHFAGALLVPCIAQLARQGHHLRCVGGDRDGRLRHLWAGPSSEVDATLFELLTAAGCAEKGRDVDFLPATDKKSPDIRCHDPYPLVIECKRQAPISKYEAAEEAVMRHLFAELREAAYRKGLSGTFRLTLSAEADQVDVSDVVAKLVGQRLAARPDRPLAYSWGETALVPLSSRTHLPQATRIYSPNMLEFLFGWTSDLPNWDGLCCSVDSPGDVVIDEVRRPIALIWKNTSPNALRKRTWAPTNLFGQATGQIPSGEFGIIYVSYLEGARSEVANLRVSAFKKRIQEWEHSAKIRVPISILCRLYPRPLIEGQPDLIESGVRFL